VKGRKFRRSEDCSTGKGQGRLRLEWALKGLKEDSKWGRLCPTKEKMEHEVRGELKKERLSSDWT